MTPFRHLAVFFLLAALSAAPGCAFFVLAGAGAAGVGAMEYKNGELKQVYAAPMERAWKSAVAAAEELGVKVTERSIDNLDQNRTLKGETVEGKNIQIHLAALSPEVTQVTVRIGIFGDETYSKKVQEVIARKMGKGDEKASS